MHRSDISILIDRLKIIESKLSKYAISTPVKKELRSIIEALEELDSNLPVGGANLW